MLSACDSSEAPGEATSEKQPGFTPEPELPVGMFEIMIPFPDDALDALPDTFQAKLSIGLGSSAFHSSDDPPDIFYTLTDRGPVIPCQDSKKFLGKKNLCKRKGKTDNKGKIFLTPNFSPVLYKLRIEPHETASTTVQVLAAIPLMDTAGNPINGLSPPLTLATTEHGYNLAGDLIEFDPSGLDPEALARLKDGSYWLAEEYGPSLVHVNAEGQILQRIVPGRTAGDLGAAPYPVLGFLPELLSMRKLNRGIEALAVSPDESCLFFALQSPLANPNAKTFRKSRHIRVYRYELINGFSGNPIAEYIYDLDTPKQFIDPLSRDTAGPNQSQISVTDMAGLPDNDLLILEKSPSNFKIYRVNTSAASNLLNTGLSEQSSGNGKTDSLEQTKDLESLGIALLNKQLIYSSLLKQNPGETRVTKAEGLAVLDNHHILVISDNDFGIDGAPTAAEVIELEHSLY